MKKLFTIVILPLAILGLAYLLYQSINEPVQFNKERAAREAVGIQNLKDIRLLQTTFKSANGRYAPTMDSLIDFYKNGTITISQRIGTEDDSIAFENTKKLKDQIRKANRGVIKEIDLQKKLYEIYLKSTEENKKRIIIDIPSEMAVRDTLFNDRPDFNVDNLRYIPFSDGDTVIMKTISKMVSGVSVPLFEAQMPFNSLLKGMDHQQIVNLNFERTDTDRYPGLMVGSISNPNNNAGNWE